jgi:hypothetical protein
MLGRHILFLTRNNILKPKNYSMLSTSTSKIFMFNKFNCIQFRSISYNNNQNNSNNDDDDNDDDLNYVNIVSGCLVSTLGFFLIISDYDKIIKYFGCSLVMSGSVIVAITLI